jgi:riboflavin kinase/FMN adenylyltransferase
MSANPATTVPVYRAAEQIPADFGPSVTAIGNFDGVHLGHQEILRSVVQQARTLSTPSQPVRSVAITFDPHPERFLRPETAPGLLTLMPERVRLLSATGVDAIVVLPFDATLASLAPRDFVERILVGKLGVRALHEGRNFHFGHGAAAGISELREFGDRFGFAVYVHPAVHVRGLEVSSSAVRALVASGDMRHSRWMLGRPFAVRSTPARGRGVGTRLLVPTVNLASYEGLLPAFGVYVTRLTVGVGTATSRTFQAVTNVGNRPTFEGAGFSVETHILDFEPVDLSDDTPLELEFLLRLRGEKTWPSPEALKEQIFKDVARAKRFFHLCEGLVRG